MADKKETAPAVMPASAPYPAPKAPATVEEKSE
jgi:hypothetical protein